MHSAGKIRFFFQSQVSLKDRNRLKAFIKRLFKKEGRGLESLNFIFCGDKELLSINQEYLKHNFYTDIITFDLAKVSQNAEGEIYISIDRVRENAKSLGTTMKEELLRVIIHGVLHLCGYRDKTPKEKDSMRRREDHYIKAYLK